MIIFVDSICVIIKNASFLLPHEFKANINWRAQWVLWQQMICSHGHLSQRFLLPHRPQWCGHYLMCAV